MSKSKKDSIIEVIGVVTEVLPNANFKVRIDNGHEILAHTAGKIRKRRIRILAGDRVSMEMSVYDKNRARIVYREKGDGGAGSARTAKI
ncbi:Translation initiation factor IF-1 [Candidatus Xenohaliotis californiensis]|uniref:Translation initiation factor IF-1 n=1 Tax=Candidatus Xenohaliotis californiensis TaxID=84677 RepID=A0ABP0ETX6_9RICK|nr:Translation initiation factor IF-1 [Candidatus Xenohaliotis californiensis]